VRFTTDVVIAVLPHLQELGVVSAGEVNPETLADEVFAEVAASQSVIVGRTEIGACSRVGAA